MNKASLVASALKGKKAKAQKVQVVNKVKIDHSDDTPMKKSPPTLRLDSTDLPAIKNWKVGQRYKLELEVEMIGIRQGNEWEIEDRPDTATHATFKVKSARNK